jgi:hypothetical protein
VPRTPPPLHPPGDHRIGDRHCYKVVCVVVKRARPVPPGGSETPGAPDIAPDVAEAATFRSALCRSDASGGTGARGPSTKMLRHVGTLRRVGTRSRLCSAGWRGRVYGGGYELCFRTNGHVPERARAERRHEPVTTRLCYWQRRRCKVQKNKSGASDSHIVCGTCAFQRVDRSVPIDEDLMGDVGDAIKIKA